MRKLLFTRLGILIALLGAFMFAAVIHGPARPAEADSATSLDPWLGNDSPKCVSLDGLDKVAKVITLTSDQFQFVRAMFVVIPPVSHELPPGDHAVLAIAPDDTMAALVDGDKTCARLELPPFMVEMLMAVGRGDVIHDSTEKPL